MGVTEKTKIGTIDLTPTWESILPALLIMHGDGSYVAKQTAREELARMAKIADQFVAGQKGD